MVILFHLIIARAPLDEDPAVENRPAPASLHNGEEVLARWSDDGWYYRGKRKTFVVSKYRLFLRHGGMQYGI